MEKFFLSQRPMIEKQQGTESEKNDTFENEKKETKANVKVSNKEINETLKSQKMFYTSSKQKKISC